MVKNVSGFTAIALMLSLSVSAHASTSTYDTAFIKNNNIYTNLNQQFPNTGAGVPGSGVGVADASFVYDPATYTSLDKTSLNYVGDNGISFDLTSNAAGQDFEQIDSGPTLIIPINVLDATNVYVLASAYDGVSANFTFTGSGGATQSFTGVSLPDFNGGTINSTSSTLNDQTVLQVTDIGAGGSGNSADGGYNNYSLTELGFTLGSQFAGQTLQSVAVTSNGYDTLILGATTVSDAPTSAVPEPASWLLMLAGFGCVGMMLRGGKRGLRNAVAS